MHKIIGIDVGNYDIKTQNTTLPSSYKEESILNVCGEESLIYNGSFYSASIERNNQMTDKTENDYCLIVTLFGIAKEIIYQLRRDNENVSDAELKQMVKNIDQISIGAGLPVGFLSSNADKLQKYYMEKMGNGIVFTYRQNNVNYDFALTLKKCIIFPQDYTSVAFNEELEVPKSFTDYYVIGIGGGTVDIIPVHNGRPVVEGCLTIEKGTTVMYSSIINSIQHETGKTMDYISVETVLRGGNSIIDEKRKQRIKELASDFVNKLIDDIIHANVKLDDKPVVFVGGGSLMFREYMDKSNKIAKAEYVSDIRANAKYYAEFVK